ncbi:PREDICTED: uncharacterized protein LOC106811783 [Priapulus caudatus]|uniref:Uncharacterized protein LOC106811783 n=1 Tax=Priapulus caudatus TaxID=37621 RepID=A0ABM1EFL9_PRICU|nr:PREDICTED: uncharacterized protein LOC106811783 [Priapulus caudatus]
MAQQMLISHSSYVTGAAVIAAGPYFCAGGSLEISRDACVANASKIDAMQLVDMTFALGDMEHIDNPEHLEKAKVFLLAGKHDERVNPEVVKKTQEFYEFFLPAENVKAEYEIAAGHGIPTESHGCECRESRRPLLNNCGYNTAYALLSHIYGHLEKPSSDVELKGEFIEFDQREYFDDSNVAISMSGFGAGYVPSACRDQSGAACGVLVQMESLSYQN